MYKLPQRILHRPSRKSKNNLQQQKTIHLHKSKNNNQSSKRRGVGPYFLGAFKPSEIDFQRLQHRQNSAPPVKKVIRGKKNQRKFFRRKLL
jgi:hypothetical protein